MSVSCSQVISAMQFKSRDCSVTNFPVGIHPEFVSAWADFIATRACYDLYSRFKRPDEAIAEVGLAFLSHLSTIKRGSPFLRPTTFSAKRYSMQRACDELAILARDSEPKTGSEFSRVGVSCAAEYGFNATLSAHVPKYVDLYFAYVLKRDTDGSVRDLSAMLHRMHTHLFGSRDMPKLYSATGIPALRGGQWPKLEALADKPSSWTELSDGLSVARAAGNVLCYRKRVYPKNIVYLKRDDFSRFIKIVNKTLSK